MNKLLKSFGFVLLLSFVLLGAIGGCSNDGSSGNNTKVLTENDFSEDASLSAEADEGIVVDFLEPPTIEKPERDTGEVGIDIIPYKYEQTISNTFCWEDEDQGAEHFMTLVNSEGTEVLMVEVNGECATALIEEGDYEMQIHHDGKSEDSLAIFIQSAEDLEQLEARNTNSNNEILKTAKSIISETLSNIGIIKEARAQVPGSDIETLLTTGNCSGCRLFRANLAGADLTGTNLEEANLFSSLLTEAKLINANLAGAKLGNADMTGADLTEANLTSASLLTTNLTGANLTFANLATADMTASKLPGANLTGANLNTARLVRANLIEATLTRADLTNANLFNADLARAGLLNAILTGADLGNANLVGATWIDGGICQPGSIGMCIL
ncbi:MAG: pentapeptide repeat-containing protein [Thermodesulfobacteriota bacterium]